MLLPYIITDNNIHITDSYTYSKESFSYVFEYLRNTYPTNSVLINRSDKSLSKEWATHNLLYDLHIFRSHTSDVDLNYPQKWYEKIGYAIVGTFALWVIR